MNDLKRVFMEITPLTLNIETNYSKLYRSLDENPMTIPGTVHPHTYKDVMMEYLNS